MLRAVSAFPRELMRACCCPLWVSLSQVRIYLLAAPFTSCASCTPVGLEGNECLLFAVSQGRLASMLAVPGDWLAKRGLATSTRVQALEVFYERLPDPLSQGVVALLLCRAACAQQANAGVRAEGAYEDGLKEEWYQRALDLR